MKQLKISLLMLLLFTVFTGLVYPLTVTVIGSIFFGDKAEGSLIIKDGVVKGSGLVGQNFTKPEYFHGRPSAVSYDSASSGGSNLGPANKRLIESVKERAAHVRNEYGLNENSVIPSELLFASGSGLDPHISYDYAVLQAGRIAVERKIEISYVINLIDKYKERQLPFYGGTYVNVLKLNCSLDELNGAK